MNKYEHDYDYGFCQIISKDPAKSDVILKSIENVEKDGCIVNDTLICFYFDRSNQFYDDGGTETNLADDTIMDNLKEYGSDIKSCHLFVKDTDGTPCDIKLIKPLPEEEYYDWSYEKRDVQVKSKRKSMKRFMKFNGPSNKSNER